MPLLRRLTPFQHYEAAPISGRVVKLPRRLTIASARRNATLTFLNPSIEELKSEFQKSLTWISAHKDRDPSSLLVVYSWSECDESGNCLMPTIGDPTDRKSGRYRKFLIHSHGRHSAGPRSRQAHHTTVVDSAGLFSVRGARPITSCWQWFETLPTASGDRPVTYRGFVTSRV